MYYQDDRRVDGANIFIRESLHQPNARTASDKLALAAKLLSDTKEATLELHALKETTVLLRMQETFDRDLTDTFSGLSVNETLFKLIRLGYNSQAKKIQSEFKVPDKVAWWIRYVMGHLRRKRSPSWSSWLTRVNDAGSEHWLRSVNGTRLRRLQRRRRAQSDGR